LRPKLSNCAFPPLPGSGLCSRENDRLQLRGSGGFSPRFPNIPPANCLTLVQPRTNIFPGQSHSDALKTHVEAQLCKTHKTAVRVLQTETRILQPEINIFSTGSPCRKNRHQRSLRESIRIDVNLVGLLARASLDRSTLPSALTHQWRARLDPRRLQWLGRSGVKPDSHTTPSHKFYTGWKGASQILFIKAGQIRGHSKRKRKARKFILAPRFG
jgi:hypothetical protein